MTQYTFPRDINEYVDTGLFIRADGSRALTGDWDIGAGRKVRVEEIRARSADGLKLFDDGGSGLFVKDGGNVGIGTTSPESALHVCEGLIIQHSPVYNSKVKLYAATYGAVGNSSFYIQTQQSNTYTTQLAILPNGNVGIGTTVPGYPLEVNGSIKIGQNVGVGTNPSSFNAAGNEFFLSLSRTITDATASSVKRCIDNSINIEPAAAAAVYYQGISGLLNIPNTVTHNLNGYIRGVQGICYHRANTTLNQMVGLYAYVGTYNSGSDSSGTINTLFGVYVGGAKTASSTITTAYGLYITGIAGSTAYDIYAGGAGNKNYFAGSVGIGTPSPTGRLDINADGFRVRTAKTPASSGASGNAGDICWDGSYVYVCVATDTWKRAALSTW